MNVKSLVTCAAIVISAIGTAAVRADLSNWNSYFVKVNDQLSSIFLDLSLHEHAPMEKYPNLSWYWVKMNSPRTDGLSSQSEFDALIKHEDSLLDFMENKPLVYVGRITTQGRREFYFYTEQGFEFTEAIKRYVGDEPTYKFQSGQKRDENWGTYLNLLYPGDNGLKQMRERK